MRFATFVGSDAAGLKGPGPVSRGETLLPLGVVVVAEAAAASNSSPFAAAGLGLKRGSWAGACAAPA